MEEGSWPPYFMNTPVLFISPFSNFVQPPSPLPCHLQPPAPLLFLRLNWWLRHIWCAVLLNDIMDLHMSSLGTLVPEGPCCVFYATRYQVYWNLIPCVFFASTLICYHTQTHKDISHSGTKRLTHPHRYVLSFVLTAAMCITLNG